MHGLMVAHSESLCTRSLSDALMQVDDRLGGEGTGKILGVSGLEGWAIIGVFAAIWAAYYASTRDLDIGGNDDDSGLSL